MPLFFARLPKNFVREFDVDGDCCIGRVHEKLRVVCPRQRYRERERERKTKKNESVGNKIKKAYVVETDPGDHRCAVVQCVVVVVFVVAMTTTPIHDRYCCCGG